MYKRILVPLDGSDLSQQSLPYAQYIAEKAGASLDIIQVIEVSTARLPRTVDAGPHGQHSISDEHLGQSLETIAAGLRESIVSVRTLIIEGLPAEAILNEAARVEGTLIVMTTHGRSGLSRLWLGSVADKVVRQAVSPVLVVTPTDHGQPRDAFQFPGSIVLTLDGSELAEKAMPHAVGLSTTLMLGLTLLRVVDPLGTSSDASTHAAHVAQLQREAKAYLQQIAARLMKEGVSSVSHVVATGYPALAILDSLSASGEQLVVMATHGRSGIGRLLLGSVTDRVIRNAQGPVLVVPVGRRAD